MRSYFKRLCEFSSLYQAWRRISKTNKFSYGFDEVTIEEFARNSDKYLVEIKQQLQSGTFAFTPARGVLLDKDGGKKRPIKVPAVRDRVVLKAIELLIRDKFRKYNLPCSFGYVPGRSVPQAIAAVRRLHEGGLDRVLEGDISRFFDTVDRTLLIERFTREIRIPSLHTLIKNALQVEIGNRQCFTPTERELFPAADSGIPQGGILSPLLANFYLYPFDRAMTDAGYHLIRFADDFVVMCATPESARAAYRMCREALEGKLNLKIHHLDEPDSKTRITLFSKGFTLLGIRFEGKNVYPSAKAIMKFREKVQHLTDPKQGLNLLTTLNKLQRLVVGWGNAYQSYDTEAMFRELDEFVARCTASYLQANGFLNPGASLAKSQRKVLGLPFLLNLRQ